MRVAMQIALVFAVVVLGGSAAQAQAVDPVTGAPIDPGTDPVGFATSLTKQLQDTVAQQAANLQEQQKKDDARSAQQDKDFQDFVKQSSQSSDNASGASAQSPIAARPVMLPAGGTFHGSVQVTLSDASLTAKVHYTLDGTKPTPRSPLYTGPITITTNTKLRIVAFDDKFQPSFVVTKKFKFKA